MILVSVDNDMPAKAIIVGRNLMNDLFYAAIALSKKIRKLNRAVFRTA